MKQRIPAACAYPVELARSNSSNLNLRHSKMPMTGTVPAASKERDGCDGVGRDRDSQVRDRTDREREREREGGREKERDREKRTRGGESEMAAMEEELTPSEGRVLSWIVEYLGEAQSVCLNLSA
jgi:hypothetical protein